MTAVLAAWDDTLLLPSTSTQHIAKHAPSAYDECARCPGTATAMRYLRDRHAEAAFDAYNSLLRAGVEELAQLDPVVI